MTVSEDDLKEVKARAERLQRYVETLDKRVIEMERSHSVADVIVKSIDKRLGGIEDSQKWLGRLIVGAILMALLGALLNGSFAP